MNLTFIEDYSRSTQLDSELIGTPDSGLYFNSGVHPLITVQNLLKALPNVSYTPATYAGGTTYSEYTGQLANVVTHDGNIYLSKVDSNTGNTPDASPTQWQLTDLDSLRIRAFILNVENRVKSDLLLTRRLVDNQRIYMYDDSQVSDTTLPNDFAGVAFEPRGSDYVKFVLNQVSFRANTAVTLDLYVVHNGTLVDTLSVTPDNGYVNFNRLDYSFSGPGRWIFAFDSQSVKSGGVIDPLRYEGFIVNGVTGTGSEPEEADYDDTDSANGIGIEISAYKDTSDYVASNLVHYSQFTQTTFELMALELIRINANDKANREIRNATHADNLTAIREETKVLDGMTVARRYDQEKKRAIAALEKTLDTQLSKDQKFRVKMRGW